MPFLRVGLVAACELDYRAKPGFLGSLQTVARMASRHRLLAELCGQPFVTTEGGTFLSA